MTYVLKDSFQNKICKEPKGSITFVVRSIVKLATQVAWKRLLNTSYNVNQWPQNEVGIVSIA